MFAVILGIDGSGKTSLLDRFRKTLSNVKAISAYPSDLFPIQDLDCFNWALDKHPSAYLPALKQLSRTAFHMQLIALEYDYYIKTNEKNNIICDSYWYRMYAKEKMSDNLVEKLFLEFVEHLSIPDIVFLINIPYEVAYFRKSHNSDFETFKKNQEWIMAVVLQCLKHKNVEIIEINGLLEIEEKFQKVLTYFGGYHE